MASEETHFYTETCDMCTFTHKREWAEDRVIERYYFGLQKSNNQSSYEPSSCRSLEIENEIDVCPECAKKLTVLMKKAIASK